ncbi:hypothetical protein [Faecalicoccus acidiformans]|nr:hypothetical protein [Faecalicoccus acidiformans]
MALVISIDDVTTQKMTPIQKSGVKKTPELLGVFIFIGKALNHVFG